MTNQSLITQHSSHLWVNNQKTAELQIINQLQKILCNNGCTTCTTCINIAKKTHPWVFWLEAENSYTLEQIDEVITFCQFNLIEKEKRFFIFTNAHDLTPSCCNKLLKTIEEPQPGYHFIFITSRRDDVLQTLQSRCFIHSGKTDSSYQEYQDIIELITTFSFQSPIVLLKLIDQKNIKESQTKDIIDILLELFCLDLKKAIKNNNKDLIVFYLEFIAILNKSLQELPLPGSAKLFWKNLLIQFHFAQTCLKK